MLTEDKVTELCCMADDFCKFFDAMMEKYTLKSGKKRRYHRDSTMSKSEIMLIMILFHDSGYRCLKHFYLEKVCRQLRHLFSKVVSYNRFVELEKEVAVPLALFIKKVLLGKCTGISFVDSTPLRVVGSALDALPHCCGRFPKACPRTVLTRLHVHGSPLHHNLVIMYMRITVRTHCQRFSVHLQHSLFPFCVFR